MGVKDKKTFLKKNNFMALFYGWGSTRLQRHYKETVYFLPLCSHIFLEYIHLINLGRMKG